MKALPPPIQAAPPSAPQARPVRSRRRVWLVVLVVAGLGLALPIAGLSSYLHLGGEARALRNSLLQATPGQWNETIEISIGSPTLTLARAILRLARVDLEPDALAVLHAVHAGEVGIYQKRDRQRPFDVSTFLQEADKALAARGWDRLVGVVQRGQCVSIYTPASLLSTSDVKVCLVVADSRQVVVVSARGNLEQLLLIAQQRPEWPGRSPTVSRPAAQTPPCLGRKS